MSCPQLLCIVLRDKDDTILCPLRVQFMQVVVKVFPPEVGLFIGVIKDPNTVICQKIGQWLDDCPILTGKRKSYIVIWKRIDTDRIIRVNTASLNYAALFQKSKNDLNIFGLVKYVPRVREIVSCQVKIKQSS